jgi:hypothetical protein
VTPDPAAYFRDNVPTEWFAAPVEVRVDRDEIVVIGELAAGVDPREFRERSRPFRMRIADAAEARFLRKVSWGVRHNGDELRFTTVSVPVMTRLRIDERNVLDALIEGGIARTRSEALGWCVRLVGQHQREWLDELVAATESVRAVRNRGPKV